MIAITRGRIVAAAGILSLSGLLAAAVAVPAPQHDVKTAMTHEGTPKPFEEIKLTQWQEAKPAPQQDIRLTSFHESTPDPYEG